MKTRPRRVFLPERAASHVTHFLRSVHLSKFSALNSPPLLHETYKAIDRSGSASQAFGDSNASNLEGVSAGITSELSADYRPYVYNLINCDFIHSAVGFSGY